MSKSSSIPWVFLIPKPTNILFVALPTSFALIAKALIAVVVSLTYFMSSSPLKFAFPPSEAIEATSLKFLPKLVLRFLSSPLSFAISSSVPSTYFFTSAKAASSSMANFIGTARLAVFARVPARFPISSEIVCL